MEVVVGEQRSAAVGLADEKAQSGLLIRRERIGGRVRAARELGLDVPVEP